jgi:CDP-glucose 4,6-dehydratase
MRQSFFNEDEMRISTVRAGNVIGGGDWASNRLVTDLLRAVQADEPMELRNPTSRRPWQHVLEPISAYLEIARMNHQCTLGSDSFNIGPDSGSEITTEDFARKFMEAWGAHHLTSRIVKMEKHEAKLLMLDNAKIKKSVGWAPRWSIEKAIDSTVGWYREYYRNGDVQKSTLGQIEEYFRGSPV